MFHTHKWKMLSTHKFQSQLGEFNEMRAISSTVKELSKRGVITVSQCEKCGKIEHLKTIL